MFIDRALGKLVKRLHVSFGIGKKRSTHKGGWSPHFTVHKAHLETLVEIRRFAAGTKAYRKWSTDEDMQIALPHILAPWVWALGNIDVVEEQSREVDLNVGHLGKRSRQYPQ